MGAACHEVAVATRSSRRSACHPVTSIKSRCPNSNQHTPDSPCAPSGPYAERVTPPRCKASRSNAGAITAMPSDA